MSISNLVNKYYDIVYQSPKVTSIEDVNDFFISEIHNSQIQRKRNAELIEATPLSKIVCVEEVLSMTQVDTHQNMQTFYLKEKIKAVGWDSKTIPMLCGWGEEKTKKYDLLRTKEVAWHRKAEELTFARSNGLSGQDVLIEEAFVLKDEVQDLSNELNLLEELQRLDLHESLPERNQSLMDTRDKVESFAEIHFFIAGESHLIEEAGETDPRCSIQPLRDFLDDKKAMILIHKKNDQECVIM